MVKTSVQAFILAAGRSRRFTTNTSKLVYPICGQPMISYPVTLLSTLSIPTTVIVGHQKELVIQTLTALNLKTVDFIEQQEQKGTGHALALTKELWHADHIIVMNGDMPLVQETLITELLEKHLTTNAAVTFVTAYQPDPTLGGYGRVVCENNRIKIVEAKDWTAQGYSEKMRSESLINAGVYLFKREFLEKACPQLSLHENSQEFYLTDLIALAHNSEESIQTITAPFDSVRGVNTLKELWVCEHIKRSELICSLMEGGVRFTAPQTITLDLGVTIGKGTTIGAATHLAGTTTIGQNCSIGDGCHIENSTIADNVTIHPNSVIKNAKVSPFAAVGPFAHVKERSTIGEHAIIGNFVEVVRSCIGEKTKIKHLSYIGDAIIGARVNIGAGTIICNYDGHAKHQTVIKDDVFIGSNNSLIAPLTIAQHAMTAAGSTITENIPEDALAIARARQVTKEGYAALKRGQHAFVAAQRDKSTIHENS